MGGIQACQAKAPVLFSHVAVVRTYIEFCATVMINQINFDYAYFNNEKDAQVKIGRYPGIPRHPTNE